MSWVRVSVKVSVIVAVLAAFVSMPALVSGQASASPAPSSTADIQRLQDTVYDIGGDIARLRGRDSASADRLQWELDSLREEVTYLKVKQRKEGRLARNEYAELRDRLESLRSQVQADPALSGQMTDERSRQGDERSRQGDERPRPSGAGISGGTVGSGAGVGQSGSRAPDRPSGTPGGYPPFGPDDTRPAQQGRATRANEVPAGTELDIRIESQLSSSTAQVEDRFSGTTMVDLYSGDRVLIPAGSNVRGVVSGVDKAGRIERKGRLVLAFDQVTVNGRAYPLHATVTQALESTGIRGEAGKIGAGAGIGAIIGGILGGFKGAMAGILIGGGGTVAATEGTDVTLPPGTVLRIRLDSALAVR